MKKENYSAAGTGALRSWVCLHHADPVVLMNSFKKRVFINKEPFGLPTKKPGRH
ncbi:MAG: hypothetical protein ACLTTZ_05870 [Lachnospiraceae bacterium]